MFIHSANLKPLILLAAGTSLVSATNVSAAPIHPRGPALIEISQSLTMAGPRERRAKRGGGERTEAFKAGQSTRIEQRTEVFESAANIDASDIQARLDAGEEAVLRALAEADTAAISQAASQIGAAAGDALEQAPGTYLSKDQTDTLVAAAARAATITEDEVDQLLTMGSLAIESYEGLDAEAIAANVNAIGDKALDLQAANKMAKRP